MIVGFGYILSQLAILAVSDNLVSSRKFRVQNNECVLISQLLDYIPFQ